MNILIGEDNKALCKVLRAYFEKEGYYVFTAFDGEETLKIFYHEKIDLVILDWMMPMRNGISVCEEIKKNSDVKVLILTAKSETDDELIAFKTGADEYIKKPFDPRILMVRVNKLLCIEDILSIEDVKLDVKKGKIFKQNEDIDATKIEFELLHYLLNHKGHILSRDQLLDKIWGYDYEGSYRTVDTHIRRLREKIGDGIIITYRGVGYGIDEKV